MFGFAVWRLDVAASPTYTSSGLTRIHLLIQGTVVSLETIVAVGGDSMH